MNKRLYALYKADQRDRYRLKLNDKEWKKLAERDKERQKEAAEILRKDKRLDASDYYRAAMIFQHSATNQRRAMSLAKKSMDMGYAKAKWLYAAAIDRALTNAGKKQKFGTQFRLSRRGTATPFPIDKRTTDELRAKYNVPPIEKTKKRIEEYWKRRR